MGMDIFFIEYNGEKDEYGHLKTKCVNKKFNWNCSRFSIRHSFAREVEMEEIHSGIYGDFFAIYRPIDFDKAFAWAKTLDEDDRCYIENMLNILFNNKNIYLEFSW